MKMDHGEARKENLHYLLNPRNIAIIGASRNPRKLGFHALKAVVTGGFRGKIYPVNPELNGEALLGYKAYKDIESIPEAVDLFVFAIPATGVIGALKEAIKKKARGAVIFAGGFKEVGSEGRSLEIELRNIADAADVNIIGPNCIGMVNFHKSVNATFAWTLSDLPRGNISVISQSGGTGMAIIYQMANLGLGLGKFISVGNRVNLEFADLFEYFAEDEETDLILLFIEGIEEGRQFFERARMASKKKPILAYNAGFSRTAANAALSHTGSAASSKEIYRAAFLQSGMLLVDSIEELVDTAKALSVIPSLEGGVVILTHSAGPSIVIADLCEEAGVSLPTFTPETQEKLLEFLPQYSKPTNPLDMFAQAWVNTDLYLKALDVIFQQEDISLAVPIYCSSMGAGLKFPAQKAVQVSKKHGKHILLCMVAPDTEKEEQQEYERGGIPTFTSLYRIGRVIANLKRYHYIKNHRIPPC
nr:hypothetical protein [Desulfobacterales bacterium]